MKPSPSSAASKLQSRPTRPSFGILLGPFALLCILLGSPADLRAQPPAEARPPNLRVVGDEVVFSVDEASGLPLETFINMASEITKKAIMLPDELNNPGATRGGAANTDIKFLGEVRVKREDFFGFFQTMLYIKNFGVVLRGEGASQLVEVISLRGAKRPEITSGANYVTADELENYRNQTGVQVLTSVTLNHLDAGKVSNALRPFFAGQGSSSPLQFATPGAAKNLLIQGFAPQVYQAYRLLTLVDMPEEEEDFVIEPVRLQHAAAEELEPLLNDLLGQRNTRAPRPNNAALPQQNAEMKILAQVTTNQLIVSGSREQVTDAKELIAQLDRPLEITEGESQVIRIHNHIAKDMQEVLKQFLTEQRNSEQQAQAGRQAAAQRRPRLPVVMAHEASNNLIISAPASKFTELKRIIDELDERQRQVLVECAVVELSTSDLKRFGIELGLLDVRDNGDFTRPFGFSHFGQSNFEDTDDDGLPDTRLPDFENPLNGFTGGIISGGDFAIPVLINALQDDNTANVLSMPSVIVNNNENALVKSEEERPTSTVTQGTATTNTGFNNFQPAGINLNISPSISSNNYLRLNVDLQVSRFITAFDPNSSSPGVKTTRQITTQVTLPSGHTMVIGGVIEDQQAVTESKVPFLGDIPLLGWLFKTHTNDKRKTNLYFFITPHILDEQDFSDLELLSKRKKIEAAGYIGDERMKMVDPKFRSTPNGGDKLEDPGATIEDLNQRLRVEFPIYRRPERVIQPGNKPPLPGDLKEQK